MKYKGRQLLLDNFRVLLSEYSVDVQDVVRSAILDGVDITKYLSECRDNPYRLDQIRLCLKEGIPSSILLLQSGSMIYKLRKLKSEGTNLNSIVVQLSKGTLSEIYLDKVICWIEKGYKISELNVSIIPRGLLDVFEYGLSIGNSMLKYNNGKDYCEQYLRRCLRIENNGKNVDFLLGGDYSLESVWVLYKYSKMNVSKWNDVCRNINKNISSSRLELLMKLALNEIPIRKLQVISNGRYVYSEEYLEYLLSIVKDNLDIDSLLKRTTDVVELKSIVSEILVERGKRLGIRLRKH